jgi:hypothetical protein
MHEQPTIRTPTISLILVMAVSVAVSGCAITGHEIVENRVVVPAGAVAKVRAVCPSGKKALGGGFDMEIPQDLRVYASDPGDSQGNIVNYGWRVMVRNEGVTARQATAIAICAH